MYSTLVLRRHTLLKRLTASKICLRGIPPTPIGKSNFWHVGELYHPLILLLPQSRFKIAYAGAVNDTHWYLEGFKRKDWNFTIPATTPPGKYLLRHEQIWPKSLPVPGNKVRTFVFTLRLSLPTLVKQRCDRASADNNSSRDLSFTSIALRLTL